MKRIAIQSLILVLMSSMSFAQTNPLERLNAIIGEWTGVGSGFGNNKSKIESSFKLVMGGTYLEISNESQFEPTGRNPKGEHHIDKGFISYDKTRKVIVFRQFNNEGYINQYVLNDSLSNEKLFVFETETIENFMPGGKAQWIIKLISDKEIETTFNVSFPNKDYTCFGVNTLIKKE
ncbi:hypothetical protein DWB61_14890 [Ancylomarina euxinus]|uniref:DUF1579 domain-containing protein n=1 Tax=Ancylomarina euxinus TaxID=2283627 RepID=A0A425XXQ5_9BACT|nr:hypothetical protein [Ancylomarina euxinus]MCZ4696001.1 hypothetical protein [Ancylomarina euxinus]MUP13942.1 hypothetical protein [Ancylomarina euxinus]RRG19498.1 hypothetical protein DWB61_14890 [Ancylomarina euxinus]